MPYPADYGGVIDVFYRIKALHSLGVDVHLHAFTYGRPEAAELGRYCSEVTYYPRKTGLASAVSKRPYIVESRRCRQLIENLAKDDAPILLEGLHCCSVLEALNGNHPSCGQRLRAPTSRQIMVRAHNVEHDYYASLARVEQNPFRRFYFNEEARRLERYESVLLLADTVLAITDADAEHFRQLGCRNVVLLPASHSDNEVVSQQGRGHYALYHADLSVGENIDAVSYLVENIFRHTQRRLVVAGRNPSPRIFEAIKGMDNVQVVASPAEERMRELIANAQVVILVTKQPTGLKLKLLNTLYAGRHCLVNSAMVAGTQLGALCTVADTPSQMLAAFEHLMELPFELSDIERRKTLLGTLYSNEANAKLLLSQLH
ncbi:MAG: glycosyltransferase [Bacteroidales bacterium]|nr:glycosyltransferase [Bacteroidales bacterium]